MRFNINIDLLDETPQETIERLNLSSEDIKQIWHAVFHDLLTYGVSGCKWTLSIEEVKDE